MLVLAHKERGLVVDVHDVHGVLGHGHVKGHAHGGVGRNGTDVPGQLPVVAQGRLDAAGHHARGHVAGVVGDKHHLAGGDGSAVLAQLVGRARRRGVDHAHVARLKARGVGPLDQILQGAAHAHGLAVDGDRGLLGVVDVLHRVGDGVAHLVGDDRGPVAHGHRGLVVDAAHSLVGNYHLERDAHGLAGLHDRGRPDAGLDGRAVVGRRSAGGDGDRVGQGGLTVVDGALGITGKATLNRGGHIRGAARGRVGDHDLLRGNTGRVGPAHLVAQHVAHAHGLAVDGGARVLDRGDVLHGVGDGVAHLVGEDRAVGAHLHGSLVLNDGDRLVGHGHLERDAHGLAGLQVAGAPHDGIHAVDVLMGNLHAALGTVGRHNDALGPAGHDALFARTRIGGTRGRGIGDHDLLGHGFGLVGPLDLIAQGAAHGHRLAVDGGRGVLDRGDVLLGLRNGVVDPVGQVLVGADEQGRLVVDLGDGLAGHRDVKGGAHGLAGLHGPDVPDKTPVIAERRKDAVAHGLTGSAHNLAGGHGAVTVLGVEHVRGALGGRVGHAHLLGHLARLVGPLHLVAQHAAHAHGLTVDGGGGLVGKGDVLHGLGVVDPVGQVLVGAHGHSCLVVDLGHRLVGHAHLEGDPHGLAGLDLADVPDQGAVHKLRRHLAHDGRLGGVGARAGQRHDRAGRHRLAALAQHVLGACGGCVADADPAGNGARRVGPLDLIAQHAAHAHGLAVDRGSGVLDRGDVLHGLGVLHAVGHGGGVGAHGHEGLVFDNGDGLVGHGHLERDAHGLAGLHAGCRPDKGVLDSGPVGVLGGPARHGDGVGNGRTVGRIHRAFGIARKGAFGGSCVGGTGRGPVGYAQVFYGGTGSVGPFHLVAQGAAHGHGLAVDRGGGILDRGDILHRHAHAQAAVVAQGNMDALDPFAEVGILGKVHEGSGLGLAQAAVGLLHGEGVDASRAHAAALGGKHAAVRRSVVLRDRAVSVVAGGRIDVGDGAKKLGTRALNRKLGERIARCGACVGTVVVDHDVVFAKRVDRARDGIARRSALADDALGAGLIHHAVLLEVVEAVRRAGREHRGGVSHRALGVLRVLDPRVQVGVEVHGAVGVRVPVEVLLAHLGKVDLAVSLDGVGYAHRVVDAQRVGVGRVLVGAVRLNLLVTSAVERRVQVDGLLAQRQHAFGDQGLHNLLVHLISARVGALDGRPLLHRDLDVAQLEIGVVDIVGVAHGHIGVARLVSHAVGAVAVVDDLVHLAKEAYALELLDLHVVADRVAVGDARLSARVAARRDRVEGDAAELGVDVVEDAAEAAGVDVVELVDVVEVVKAHGIEGRGVVVGPGAAELGVEPLAVQCPAQRGRLTLLVLKVGLVGQPVLGIGATLVRGRGRSGGGGVEVVGRVERTVELLLLVAPQAVDVKADGVAAHAHAVVVLDEHLLAAGAQKDCQGTRRDGLVVVQGVRRDARIERVAVGDGPVVAAVAGNGSNERLVPAQAAGTRLAGARGTDDVGSAVRKDDDGGDAALFLAGVVQVGGRGLGHQDVGTLKKGSLQVGRVGKEIGLGSVELAAAVARCRGLQAVVILAVAPLLLEPQVGRHPGPADVDRTVGLVVVQRHDGVGTAAVGHHGHAVLAVHGHEAVDQVVGLAGELGNRTRVLRCAAHGRGHVEHEHDVNRRRGLAVDHAGGTQGRVDRQEVGVVGHRVAVELGRAGIDRLVGPHPAGIPAAPLVTEQDEVAEVCRAGIGHAADGPLGGGPRLGRARLLGTRHATHDGQHRKAAHQKRDERVAPEPEGRPPVEGVGPCQRFGTRDYRAPADRPFGASQSPFLCHVTPYQPQNNGLPTAFTYKNSKLAFYQAIKIARTFQYSSLCLYPVCSVGYRFV